MKSSLSIPDQWCWSSKFKSKDVVLVDKDKRKAVFHPKWSDGTAAIRGNRVLNAGPAAKYYWEICLPDRIFGTSTMFGIGTEDCRLHSDSYTNLIGESNDGWALSHKGLTWNNGIRRRLCKPFEENTKTTIGLLFDSKRGTLSFFKDSEELGIAFYNLNKVKQNLYPMVSSTAARVVVILRNCRKFYFYNSLLDRCCDTILSSLDDECDINKLPLPDSLKHYLKSYRDNY